MGYETTLLLFNRLFVHMGDFYIIMTGGVVGISLLSIFINGIVVSLWNFSSTEFCLQRIAQLTRSLHG